MDMVFLIISAILVIIMGVCRLVQLSKLGIPASERIVFGVLLCNITFTLLYPLSGLQAGFWPYGLTGLAFCAWIAIRFLHAKSDQVGHYRGSVLSR